MLEKSKTINKLTSLIIILIPILFTNCGKHEGAIGTMGTISGAAVGSAVSNKKNKTTGALVGGLIGNYVGRSIGKEADKTEEKAEQIVAQNTTQSPNLLNEEIVYQKLDAKWCNYCRKTIKIANAYNCPFCGKNLVCRMFCRRCNTTFVQNQHCKCKKTKTSFINSCLKGLAKVAVEVCNNYNHKTCRNCKQTTDLAHANNCPYCGCCYNPIEKYCNYCYATFPLHSNYNYCPYCVKRITLSFR